MIIYVFFVLGTLYSLYLLVILVGWKKTMLPEGTNTSQQQKVTIIIPARNEEQSIRQLLNDLENQSYPTELMEIIVVDDYSDDGTVKVVETAFSKNAARTKLIQLSKLSSAPGKKSAITTAVKASSNEIIICTDADCRIAENWIQAHVDAFYSDKIMMVLGPVKFSPVNGFFSSVQQLEFAGLIGIGAASLKIGFPNMCNGANLSYRKSLFEEVNGYQGNEQIPSGDDEFLLQKAFDKYPDGIFFQKSTNALVSTSPKKDLNEFLNQRIRWAGKWKYHKQTRMSLWALTMFLFKISLISLLLISVVTFNLMAIGILGLRAIVEYVYLKSVCNEMNFNVSIKQFLFIQIVYPFYIIILSIISLFSTYRWKGRSYT